jgi:hypothetical protein
MTTIPLRKETRNLLKEVGRKNETYDDLILRLIDVLKKQEARVNE